MTRLRTSLVALVAWVLIPAVAFAVATSVLLALHEQQQFAQAVRDRNRAYMTAVDAELGGVVTSLRALAASRRLAVRDFAGFAEEAAAVLPGQPGWRNVVLHDTDGRQRVNLLATPGELLPKGVDPRTVERALETGAPVIGGLILAPRAGVLVIPVRVPVVEAGRVVFVLTAMVDNTPFVRLLEAQSLPPGWVSGLVDGSGRFIVRQPPRETGSRASELFRQATATATEGWYRGLTVEGLDTYTAHVTSALTGWSNGIAVPADEVWSGTRRAAWTLATGLALCVAIGAIMAARIGRRIAAPVGALAALAPRLGQEDVVVPRAQNIREIAELAAALDEAARALREREVLEQRERAALVAADRAKDEFLAMLSHELRNPLQALTAAAAILQKAPEGPAEQTSARRIVARQTRHMARLVEDLLDISRITTGKVSLAREPVEPAALARSVVETWHAAGRPGADAITVEGGPAHVDADRARLQQILENLLDNATKFSAPGGPVRIVVSETDGLASLAVVDRGTGIPAHDLPHVFELFRQGEQDLSRPRGGMGIGLALVRRLAALHGGTVSASSEGPGRGTTVTVSLPALEAAPMV